MAKNKSSIAALWRLFWRFGRTYRGHIAIGVLTGILLGGAVLGILKSSVTLLQPFELGTLSTSRGSPSAPTPALAPAGDPSPGTGKASRKAAATGPDWLEDGLKWAERLGLGHVEREQTLNLRLLSFGIVLILTFVVLRLVAIVLNNYCLHR